MKVAKSTGLNKVPDAILVSFANDTQGVTVHKQDYTRLLSIMCEGCSRTDLDMLHRVVSQRRASAAERGRGPGEAY